MDSNVAILANFYEKKQQLKSSSSAWKRKRLVEKNEGSDTSDNDGSEDYTTNSSGSSRTRIDLLQSQLSMFIRDEKPYFLQDDRSKRRRIQDQLETLQRNLPSNLFPQKDGNNDLTSSIHSASTFINNIQRVIYEHESAINYLHSKMVEVARAELQTTNVVDNSSHPIAVLNSNFQLLCCSPRFKGICRVDEQFNIHSILDHAEKFMQLVSNILNRRKENRTIVGRSKIRLTETDNYHYYVKVLQSQNPNSHRLLLSLQEKRKFNSDDNVYICS